MTRPDRDAGSAMITTLLLLLVFAVAGVVLATVVGVNAKLTLQTATRGTSVYIAESGLESALGTFRAAATTTDTAHGVLANLPCQLTGSADGSSDPANQYSVQILYGMENPAEHATDATWLAATNTAGDNPNGFTPVSCTAGAGPSTQPYYALVEARAAHGEVGARTLLAIYSFNIDTSNNTGKIGGEIYAFRANTSDPTLCLRAVSATAGSYVTYSTSCDRTSPTDSALLGWTYDTDYKIRLASTIPADDPDTAQNESQGGLCIGGPIAESTSTQPDTTTLYRWDYKLPAMSGGSGAWAAWSSQWSTAETEDDQPLTAQSAIQITYPYSTGGGGGTTNHYYYLKYNTTATSGLSVPAATKTPISGETSRKEAYVYYTVTYAQNAYNTTGNNRNGVTLTAAVTAPTSTSSAPGTYYVRKVTVTSTKNITLGGTNVGAGTYTSGGNTYQTGHAMLVDCQTLGGGTMVVTDPATGVSATVNLSASNQKNLQWGWEASNSWENSNAWCLYSGHSSGVAAAGDKLSVISSCAVSAQAAYAAYNPLTGVGAGNASKSTGYTYSSRFYAYLVNFKEFGRCADVNGQNYKSWMIVYPCKQYPAPATPAANQGWRYTEPADPNYISSTQIYIRDNVSGGTEYCLVEPSGATSVNSVSVASPRVELVVNTGTQCSQNAAKWTRYTWTGRYASSYTFVSYSGLCLTADSTTSDTTAAFPWSTMTVRGCNGQANQKWNAPPDLPLGGLGDYQEIPAGGETTP